MRHIQEGDVCEAHEEWKKRDTERKRTRGLVSAEEQLEVMDGEEAQILVKRVRNWLQEADLTYFNTQEQERNRLKAAAVKEGSKVWWIIPSNTKRGKSVKKQRKYVDVAKLTRLLAVVLERVEGDKVSGTSFHLVLQWEVLSSKQNDRNIKALQGPVEERDPGGTFAQALALYDVYKHLWKHATLSDETMVFITPEQAVTKGATLAATLGVLEEVKTLPQQPNKPVCK
eukprot:g36167.t1